MAAHEDDVRDVVDLVRGHWRVLAVRGAADLGLIDAMADPVALPSLAAQVGVEPEQLVRLLRALDDVGLVERDDAGSWVLTGRGRTVLRSDDPSGLRSLLVMQTWPPHVGSWSLLPEALRSGAGTFEAANGASLWRLMAGDPEQSTGLQRGHGPPGRLAGGRGPGGG